MQDFVAVCLVSSVFVVVVVVDVTVLVSVVVEAVGQSHYVDDIGITGCTTVATMGIADFVAGAVVSVVVIYYGCC